MDEKHQHDDKFKHIGVPTMSGDSPPDEEAFSCSWRVIVNVLALLSCYFSATWALGIPTSSIGFIVERFPEGSSPSA